MSKLGTQCIEGPQPAEGASGSHMTPPPELLELAGLELVWLALVWDELELPPPTEELEVVGPTALEETFCELDWLLEVVEEVPPFPPLPLKLGAAPPFSTTPPSPVVPLSRLEPVAHAVRRKARKRERTIALQYVPFATNNSQRTLA
jgi:hypothetical protein